MARPGILVVATPHVYASVIARAITDAGTYDVTVIDLTTEEPSGSEPFAAAITSVPVDRDVADVIIELPSSYDEPVVVRIGEITVLETVDSRHPLEDVVRLVDRYVHRPRGPHGVEPTDH